MGVDSQHGLFCPIKININYSPFQLEPSLRTGEKCMNFYATRMNLESNNTKQKRDFKGRAIKKVDEANYYLKQVISLRKLTPQSLEFANASSASVCLPTT
jgi:hypothetical protein